MTRNDNRSQTNKESQAEKPPDEPREPRAGFGAWFMSTVLRTLVAIIGLIAVLFALSMALGIDLLGMLGQALTTQTGQWLAIAVIALVVTGIAMRGLSYIRAPR